MNKLQRVISAWISSRKDTWDDVFFVCLLNTISYMMFLRIGWMIGFCGIWLSFLVAAISAVVMMSSLMSVLTIYDRFSTSSDNETFLLSPLFGSKLGGTLGLLYFISQAASTSLSCAGLAETLLQISGVNHPWIQRAVALGALLLLIFVSMIQFKYIVRVHAIMLVFMLGALGDIFIGLFCKRSLEYGVVGLNSTNFDANMAPSFTDNVSIFVVFGVIFPALSGVFSCISMTTRLRMSKQSVFVGSSASLLVSCILFVFLVLLMGASVERASLKNDYIILDKVSAIGYLFLAGVVISSTSSAFSGVYGSPRILHTVVKELSIPLLSKIMGRYGDSEMPLPGTVALLILAVGFILIGQMNVIAPLVSLPYLLIYSIANFGSFLLEHHTGSHWESLDDTAETQAVLEEPLTSKTGVIQTTAVVDEDPEIYEMTSSSSLWESIGEESECERGRYLPNYARTLHNKWVSLVAAVVCLMAMFAISWIFSLAYIGLALVLFVVVSHASPSHGVGLLQNSYMKRADPSKSQRGESPQR